MGDAGDGPIARRGTTATWRYRLATRYGRCGAPAMPEEIARCCLFLASDEASIVTGAALVADGGQTAVDLGGIAFASQEGVS